VKLQEVKEILDAEVIVGHDRLDLEVTEAGCADLISDVLVFCTAGSLLLTGLTNPNVILSANVLDIAAIIFVRGKQPSPETIQLAEELQIPILTTKYVLFASVGRLHARGIVSCMEKVDSTRNL
jgi:predicted transcriptional regulator